MEKKLKEIIKATLFVAGEGISLSSFMESLTCTEKEVKTAIEDLKKELAETNGIHIIEYKNKVQLCSNPAYSAEISSILNPIREKALTRAALETLAIIAYKQPVTKLDIEEIRGVNCDYTVQILTEHKMIEVVGRKDAVGKPLLFGTTDEFLKRFDLKDILDLPNYEDLLERIALIKTEDTKSDSLYNDYEIPQDELIPEFLQNEEVEMISSDLNEKLDNYLEDDKGDANNGNAI